MNVTELIESVSPKTTYYHGSNKKFDELKAGSWVTPYKEDALSFGVPWGSEDLEYAGDESGRPPAILKFKDGMEPPDGPLYLYAVDAETVPAKTNKGGSHSWNRAVTADTPVKLVASHSNWKDVVL